MKGFITSLIASVIFFVGFGISVAVLGMDTGAVSVYYNDEKIDYSNGDGVIISGNTISSEDWKINEDFMDIKINSSGISTVVSCSDRSNIFVSLNNNGKNVHIDATASLNDLSKTRVLTLNVSPASNSIFSNMSFGLANWLGSLFTGSYSGVQLSIELPKKLYDLLDIDQGSGSVYVNEFYARTNMIDIGSGYFELTREDKDTVSNVFELTLGSGSVSVKGMRTDKYEIEAGSGSYNIEGLTGEGAIDMGSGSGYIAFDKFNGACDLDMGSGYLQVVLPNKAGANIKCDIGSGSVDINAGGIKKTVRANNDYETIMLGSCGSVLDIDMGSGYIEICDPAAIAGVIYEDDAEYAYTFPPEVGNIGVVTYRSYPNTDGVSSVPLEIAVTEDITFAPEFGEAGCAAE